MKINSKPDILKPKHVYEMFVYPGADKWSKKECFTVSKEITTEEFMKQWCKRKRIPQGASIYFHPIEKGILKNY